MTDHHHDIDFKSAFTVLPLPGSLVKISGEIPYEELAHERAAALKKLGAGVAIDGFRKGHVPESILVKHVGDMAILMEMAERAIQHMYPHVVQAHALKVIGYPKIEITKIAPNNPLGFTATVAVLPEISLPDYRALAKGINAGKQSVSVSDDDVETEIKNILRQKAAYERLQQKAAPSEGETNTESTDETETDLPPPELTDDVARTLGQPGQFADAADLRAKLKEHLMIEKTREAEANHRAKLTDTIIDASTLELPQILIDSELEQMFARMEEELTNAHLKMDDYLSHIKKTREDLRAEWTPAATRRAKLQLILNEIATKENIVPDQKAVEEQVTALKAQYQDADTDRVRVYVATILQNEAVIKLLEASA